MKTMTYFLVIMMLFSCAPSKIVSMKGKYPNPPFIFNTTSSKDSVWDKVIDLFAQKGLPIKIIDRASGLIISDRSEISTTVENKSGSLIDPTAFIVVNAIYQNRQLIPLPKGITGEWNVRIKQNGTGSSINVNLVNLRYEFYDESIKTTRSDILHKYHSTGVFENLIFELIK